MSEQVRYTVPKEWNGEMLKVAEGLAAASSNDPETVAFVLGVLTAAWPRLIDAATRTSFGASS